MILRPPFYISGEEGKAIAGERISLESLGVEVAILRKRSVGVGTLSFRLPADGSVPVPDRKQALHLFDDGGVRLFTGRVKRSFDWQRGGAKTWQITVSDAWKELEETRLVGPVTDATGATSTRAYVTYPTQDLAISLRQLLERMQALGVPMQPGEIDPCFPVPRMTFSKSTGAEALGDMLRWIPDAMTELDPSEGGLPKLHIRRRPKARVITLELETDPDDTEEVTLQDQPELLPGKVEVQAATRDATTGKMVFRTLVAGDVNAPDRETQTVVTSGPENNSVLPKDVYENASIQTGVAQSWGYVKTVDQELKDAIATYGDVTLPPETVFSRTFYSQDPSNGGSSWTFYTSPLALYDKDNNLLGGAWYRLSAGAPIPDWAGKDHGFVVKEGFLRGQFGGLIHRNAGSTGISLRDYSETLYRLKLQGKFWDDTVYDGPPWTSANMARYGWYAVDLPMTLISVPFEVLTELWRLQDYDYLFPPLTLADDLFAAQNWLPFTGDIRLGPNTREIPVPGRVVSLRNADPLWETARALVESTEIELMRRTATVTIGTPPRTSGTTLLDQFRSAARDNVT